VQQNEQNAGLLPQDLVARWRFIGKAVQEVYTLPTNDIRLYINVIAFSMAVDKLACTAGGATS